MKTTFNREKNKGFTLLEMVISISIFTILVIAVTTIMLIVSSAQRKVTDIQAVQDNIRFIFELLTKEMRSGSNFSATTYCAPAGKEIQFIANNDVLFPNRTYFLQGDTLMRAKQFITSSAQCSVATIARPLSGEEVKIEILNFFLHGPLPWPSLDGQPLVTISMRISARDPKFGTETTMNLQSTVTSRFRDIGP